MNGADHGILAVGSSLCGLFNGFVGHGKSLGEAPVRWPGIIHKYRFIIRP